MNRPSLLATAADFARMTAARQRLHPLIWTLAGFGALALLWLAPEASTATLWNPALTAFDEPDCVRADWHIDDGPGTPVIDRTTYWVSKGRGIRTESSCLVEVKSLSDGMQYEWSPASTTVTSRKIADPAMEAELLARCNPAYSVEAQRAGFTVAPLRNPRSRGAIPDVQRFSAIDERGRDIIADVEVSTGRLVRTESWLLQVPDERPARMVVTFEYPSAAELAEELFRPPTGPGVRIVAADDDEQRECMAKLRQLCMAVHIYAQEHGGALPSHVAELARYAPGGDLDGLLSCHCLNGDTATVIYMGSSINAAALDEVLPDAVLFECNLPTGKVLGFQDGHAEFRAGDSVSK